MTSPLIEQGAASSKIKIKRKEIIEQIVRLLFYIFIDISASKQNFIS